MKTAVDFLHSEYKRILGSVLVTPQQIIEMSDALENAKEIERGQIIEAHTIGYIIGGGNGDLYNPKEYYNETFKQQEQ
jgi:hypothetical protein